jgi:3-hydroxyacyl-CoA dehydrogenase
MQIKTVGVLGCGLMGAGIAQVSAAAGYRTIVREVDQALLDKGLGRVRKFLEDGVAKGKVTAEARDTTYYIANIMFEEFREPAYAPPPLLKRMVLAGRMGRKSGQGFYKY